jgi:hypothetical protein
MRCPACGFENASGMKFCGECGASLKIRCSSCGFENPLAIKFCGECGKPLSEASKPPPPPDPRCYTPKHLAEKIRQNTRAVVVAGLAALAEAEAWLEMSGAKSYEPFLHVERARLARLIIDDFRQRQADDKMTARWHR